MRYLLALLLLTSSICHGQEITTIIGNGVARDTGFGGPASAAAILYPCGGKYDNHNDFYFGMGDEGWVSKVAPSGIISIVAGYRGSGTSTLWGDGGPATLATLRNVQSVAIDSAGDLYICDNDGSCIRKVDEVTGVISTIVGDSSGTYAYGGDGGPATDAKLYGPLDICFDRSGNLYIADHYNARVRRVDRYGIITTVVGIGVVGGHYYYGGDGGFADTTSIYGPSGVCMDHKESQSLYIADWYARVMKVDASGIITTVAGNGISGESGDGGPATDAEITPYKIALDNSGRLFIAEYDVNRVRMVDTNGIITTVAGNGIGGFSGDGGAATAAEIYKPGGITFDSCDNLIISDSYNARIRKVTYNPSCGMASLQASSTPPVVTTLTLYPDPATDQLTITAPALTEGMVIVTNLLGRAVRTQPCHTITTTINVADLPPGMYFVSITGTPYTGRFIKE